MADVIAMYVVVDGKQQRQMLLPIFYQGGRCFAILFVAGGRPLMLHVTAFEDSRCYCQVADGITTVGWVTANW